MNKEDWKSFERGLEGGRRKSFDGRYQTGEVHRKGKGRPLDVEGTLAGHVRDGGLKGRFESKVLSG